MFVLRVFSLTSIYKLRNQELRYAIVQLLRHSELLHQELASVPT